MNCRQSQRFAEHKTVSGGWFIVAGRTRALLCMHIVYVLMEMWPLLRNIPQTWNDNNTQSGGKKWLGLANWNLWLSLHFISIKSSAFFAVITPHSRSNSWITLCLFPLHPTHIIPYRPVQLCCPSVLSPRAQIKMAPSFFHQIQGVYVRALLVREGSFVIKLTCAVLTKQMSQTGLRPGSTVCMTHSFVMHWPVCVLLPKRCPGSRPDLLLIHSAVLREKHRHKMAATATALSFE